MNAKTPIIYQSGQTVAVTGMYEVVGTSTKTKTSELVLRNFYEGDSFPCFDGRIVAWHVLDTASEQALKPSLHEKLVPSHN